MAVRTVSHLAGDEIGQIFGQLLGGNPGVEPFVIAAKHLPKQIFLAAEITADQRHIDAGIAGYVPQADGLVTFGEKTRPGRGQDGVPGRGRTFAARHLDRWSHCRPHEVTRTDQQMLTWLVYTC